MGYSGKLKADFDEVYDAFVYSQEGKGDFMERALKWNKQYRQVQRELKKDEPEDTPNNVCGKAFSTVEQAVAKQRTALIPRNINDPIIRTLPTEINDVNGAKADESVLNYYIRQCRLRSKINIWLREYNKYGVGPARVFWRHESRKIKQERIQPVVIPIGNMVVGIKQIADPQSEHVIFDGPDVDPISIDDWFPDPSASAYDEFGQSFAIVRYYLNYKTAEKLSSFRDDEGNPVKPIFNRDWMQYIKPDDIPPPRDSYELESEDVREIGSRFDETGAMKGLIECLEYYTGDSIITIGNRECVMRKKQDNPYWHGRIPLVCPSRLREAGSPFGTGQIEPMYPTIEQIISIRNARAKNVSVAINRMWKMLRDAGIDTRELTSRQNGIIKVTDMDDLEALEIPDVTSNAYNEEAILNNDLDIISGLSGLAAGINPPSVRSGIQTFPLMDVANERAVMDVETFADEGLIPMAQQFHWLIQQFGDDELHIRVLGEKGYEMVKINKEDIGREYDYYVEAAIRTTPLAVEANQQLAYMNSMAMILQGFPDMALQLYKSGAEKQGLKDVVAALDTIIEQVAQERKKQGGILNNGGEGTQALAGVFGGAGGNAGNPNAGNSLDQIFSVLNGGGGNG